ncbi:hypothetical protein LENED_002621 [Lentinula edodes]|uniref:Uncharacterized protein n=1 Tax=Lentinula edodes TaxID=5353 RepID=A0A1Q3E1K5_LENED|nr:hypothetical protein LENED_002621 [Lentinula edodes]
MPSISNERIPARDLWLSTGGGLPEDALSSLTLSKEPDCAINSSFKIGSAAQTTIGLAGLSASYFHELRTGVKQTVLVDARHAVLEFRSEAYYKCILIFRTHGADVLLVTSPKLPALPALDVDTSRGKRTTQLDLTCPEDKEKLQKLILDADVFLQAYRPGALEGKGFGTHEIVKMKGDRDHGIICANLCAWGWDGPWKSRRGFDSLVQTATGFNTAESQAHAESRNSPSVIQLQPKPFPVQALDHAAGYLMAYGINVALCKTINEGGSWEVRVSLAAVAQWLRSLGRVSPEELILGMAAIWSFAE